MQKVVAIRKRRRRRRRREEGGVVGGVGGVYMRVLWNEHPSVLLSSFSSSFRRREKGRGRGSVRRESNARKTRLHDKYG